MKFLESLFSIFIKVCSLRFFEVYMQNKIKLYKKIKTSLLLFCNLKKKVFLANLLGYSVCVGHDTW